MKKAVLPLFMICSIALLYTFINRGVQANFGSLRYAEILDMEISEDHITFTVSWAIYTVQEWADCCCFRIWIMRESGGVVLASWWIGLNNILDTGSHGEITNPGFEIQGIGSILGRVNLRSAENPYMYEDRNHPLDGLHTYYFYKAYVTVQLHTSIDVDDVVQFAGDYERFPEYYDGELSYYGSRNSGSYFRTSVSDKISAR